MERVGPVNQVGPKMNNELPFQAGIAVKETNRIKSAASDALKYGEKKNNRISLLFIGQDRVGKTSLKKTLLGEETQQYEESTIASITKLLK